MKTASATLRIGELAERAGVTPRTIRYYEELGLLQRHERAQGTHRLYGDADVERLRELTRLRDLLGLSLDELRTVIEAEDARPELRERFFATESRAERRQIVETALPALELQLTLVQRRLVELGELEQELLGRRKRLRQRRRELGD